MNFGFGEVLAGSFLVVMGLIVVFMVCYADKHHREKHERMINAVAIIGVTASFLAVVTSAALTI